jgi:hypothetical protein
MTDESTDVFAPAPRGRIECAVTTLAAASALLLLDNQLGPVSFTLRRAAAATVLATLAVLRWTHKSAVAAVEINDGSGAVSPSRAATGRSSVPTNLGWSHRRLGRGDRGPGPCGSSRHPRAREKSTHAQCTCH